MEPRIIVAYEKSVGSYRSLRAPSPLESRTVASGNTSRRSMKYRSIINIDYVGTAPNEYTRLRLALRGDGWTQVETRAFIRESASLADIWRGIDLVARQSSSIGFLSALTFHIQGSEDFAQNVSLVSNLSGENALAEVRSKPFPP